MEFQGFGRAGDGADPASDAFFQINHGPACLFI
jgi:hypothetical protein